VSYKAEVIADHTGDWNSNDLRFAAQDAAERYARDLAWRWTMVREWRVVECDDPVNTTDGRDTVEVPCGV